jgi:hypothetical protein
MKRRFLILVIFLILFGWPALPQQAGAPLGKDQVMDLVKAGMETPELVKLIHEHGIDFDLTDDYLQALRTAGAQEPVIQALRAVRPRPLSKEQVLELEAGHVPSQRAAALVKEHGIDFVADERYLQTLRLAGGDETLIAALREASQAVRAELVVSTTPDAEIYLDGTRQGRADSLGQFAAQAAPGAHTLKITRADYKDHVQAVTLTAHEITKAEAPLVPASAELTVVTSPGAEVYLNGELQGKAGLQGELALKPKPGTYTLKVSLRAKQDFEQSVTLAAERPTRIEATLKDAGLNPEANRERILAEDAVHDKNWDSALEHYRKGVVAQPRWSAGWWNLALIYAQEKADYADAALCMRHYVELIRMH